MNKAARLGIVTSGCVLVALACSSGAQESPNQAFKPLVSVMELMQQTITPATDQLWSAYNAPSTPAEWRAMENAAATLLAASSLVATGGTGDMDNDWAKEPAWQAYNAAMITAGQTALTASRAQDIDGLLEAGDLLLAPCEGCHQQFNPAVVNAQ